MAKDRDRAVNPAAAQRKLEKQKALKKGKATLAAQRTERLAQRNPTRLQRQIDELRGQAEGRELSGREKKVLEELERDVGRVRKAREEVGVQSGGGGVLLGKRGRGEGGGRAREREKREREREVEESSTDESVRQIPMPRDTPPPLPRVWRGCRAGNANAEPLGRGREGRVVGGGGEVAGGAGAGVGDAEARTPQPSQVVYEAKPAVRDLRREAVQRFVPGAVARKLGAKRGEGSRLLEEEEVERLEREGYGDRRGKRGEEQALREEEDSFEREVRGVGVEVEEVEDEGS